MARARPLPPPVKPVTRAGKSSNFVVTDSMVAQARGKRSGTANNIHPFIRATHPKSVFPAGFKSLAMDSDIDQSLQWAQQIVTGSAFQEGLVFLGYPYLAEVAQRSEYRRISEIIATEMTRKWIKLQSKDTEEDKTDRINELKDAMENLNVQGVFREVAEQDGFFGRGHIYIDTGDTDKPDELRTPIGTGTDDLSKNKVAKGSLKRLKTVEAVWCYPSDYNSNDPLQPDWYKPREWFVQGKRIHASRLLTFIGREVPDLLKPAYSFGGLSLSQMAKPYIDNWLRTRQSVSDLLHSFSVFVLETDLASILSEGSDQLFKRLDLFNNLRDNRGLMVTSKATEGFQNVAAPLGGLHELQAQSQEQICSVVGIPLLKYTGIQPAGLNASSEGEIRTFYDWIAAYQESLFTKNLTRVIHFVMLHLWGEVDQDIIFEYEPLWSLDGVSLATKRKTEADIDTAYLQANVLSELEVRKRIAADPDSPYTGLDVEDVPMPTEEEMGMGMTEGAEGQEQGEAGEGASKPAAPIGAPKAEKPSQPSKPTKPGAVSKPAPAEKPVAPRVGAAKEPAA